MHREIKDVRGLTVSNGLMKRSVCAGKNVTAGVPESGMPRRRFKLRESTRD